MKIIELTHLLKDKSPVFPGDPSFSLKEEYTHNIHGFSLSLLKTGLHVGTHIDSPYHFHPGGRQVNDISLEELTGSAHMIKLKGKVLEKSHIKNIPSDQILIIHTGWDRNWKKPHYFHDHPYLSLEAAKLLLEKGIKGIGIDGPSVDVWGETKIHQLLLENDIWIVENLTKLHQITDTEFEIFFIPLLIDAEGSMVRAFARIK